MLCLNWLAEVSSYCAVPPLNPAYGPNEEDSTADMLPPGACLELQPDGKFAANVQIPEGFSGPAGNSRLKKGYGLFVLPNNTFLYTAVHDSFDNDDSGAATRTVARLDIPLKLAKGCLFQQAPTGCVKGVPTCKPCAAGSDIAYTPTGIPYCMPLGPLESDGCTYVTPPGAAEGKDPSAYQDVFTVSHAESGCYDTTPGCAPGRRLTSWRRIRDLWSDQTGHYVCSSCPKGSAAPASPRAPWMISMAPWYNGTCVPQLSVKKKGGYFLWKPYPLRIQANDSTVAKTRGCSPLPACPKGTSRRGVASLTCKPCAPGSRRLPDAAAKAAKDTATILCEPCPAGTFSRTPNSGVCTPCPAGAVSKLGLGSTGCRGCPKGSVANAALNSCQWSCPSNTYRADALLGSPCLPCPAGRVSPAGSVKQSACVVQKDATAAWNAYQSSWRCILNETLGSFQSVPLRWDGANPQCASYDGRYCIFTVNPNTRSTPTQMVAACKRFLPNLVALAAAKKLKPVSCGSGLVPLLATTGYDTVDEKRGLWCPIAWEVFAGYAVGRGGWQPHTVLGRVLVDGSYQTVLAKPP